NTTSVLQPMDQGVMRSLKAHYRRRVVRLLCGALENNKPLSKISILSGMKIFKWVIRISNRFQIS
ncbi:MAG: hypothetical protein AAFY76_16535, partial [Cyanobacteria bacterium J06649_11]